MFILSFAIPVDAAISATASCFKTMFAAPGNTTTPPTPGGSAVFVLLFPAAVTPPPGGGSQIAGFVRASSGGSSLSIT